MKQIKTILILSIVYCLLSIVCVYAADLQVESGGKLRTETFTFSPEADPGSTNSSEEGRVVYFNNQLRFSDGSDWQSIGGGKTVATRIVAAADSSLANKTADYICDGTGDQAEIQQAINDLGSNGGVVYLLEGTYSISTPIVFNNTAPRDSNKALIGTGAGTVLKPAGSVNVISAASVSNILIRNLTVSGKVGLSGRSGKSGIVASSLSASKICDIRVEYMNEYGMDLSVSDSVISGNYLAANGFDGIRLIPCADTVVSLNVISNNNQNAIRGVGITNSSIVNNQLVSNNNRGIYFWSGNSNIVSGNNIALNKLEGIGIGDVTQTNYGYTISSNIISSNGSLNSRPGIAGVFSRSIISNNSISFNAKFGIEIAFSNENNISANLIYNNGASGANDGINLTDCDYNNISYNRVSDMAGPSSGMAYMINISDSASSGNYIVSNQLNIPDTATGNLASIKDLGTGTQYTGKDKVTLEPVNYPVSDGGKIILSSVGGTGPVSYLRLSVSGSADIALANPAIEDGNALGDLLIIENASSYKISVNDESISGSNFEIYKNDDNRTWGKNTTSKFIWDGRAWLELSHADN
ncbi:MAG: hypothetical protein COV72_07715 [Candidatus Omnitrophica bacterium CG11_big_fil_rev_8_21_14_0_20_42_13]|uniref:Periplasmic copper-binding protein NosD beta helix domain-containing protein n=1 Tax=Candidatus Ghiorseimicrobium undicola TaxID=1974746 RepID=A0A2H0LVX7_9BACT|nr:MAG: hypothetical protein COV72_07715 [Candidatus Omnitrophica bacterium CG11_big_fil_rev_8_21_14_0_20_42_13]